MTGSDDVSVHVCTVLYNSVMISISKARATLPELVDRVQAGEELVFSRHGVPVAVLISPDALRVRRAATVLAEAGAVREMIAASRARPLADGSALSAERADEMVDAVRRDRAPR